MKTLLMISFSVFFVFSIFSCATVPEKAGQRHEAQEYQAPQPAEGPHMHGQPHHGRHQMGGMDACVGKNQNDACEFSAPHGTVTGICRVMHDQLTCTPKGAPGKERQHPAEYQTPPPTGGPNMQGQPPQRKMPPKEIVDACVGKNQNDACEFAAPHGTVTGICRTMHNQLSCAPKGAPGRDRHKPGEFQPASPAGGHQIQGQQPQRRMPPKEIVDACVGKKQDDACEFTAPHGKVTGICRTMHNQLSCSPKGAPGRDRHKPGEFQPAPPAGGQPEQGQPPQRRSPSEGSIY